MAGIIAPLPDAGEFTEPARNVSPQPLVGALAGDGISGAGARAEEFSDGGAGPGILAEAYSDVIDHQVIQLPYCTDLGEFSEDQSSDVVLWNNNAEDPVQLIAINQDGVPGIVVTGIDVTDTIDRLAHTIITLEVEGITAGAGDFESNIEFVFENVNTLEVFTVPICVIGSRFIPPVLFLANWETPISVSTRWKSTRDSSRTAVVTRRLQISRPQRIMEFLIQAMRLEDLAVLDVMVQRNADGETFAPLYSDVARLSEAASVDDTTIFLNANYRRFSVGSRCIVGTPTNRRALFASSELRVITSVTDTSIGISPPLDFDHPKGARVYPALEILPVRSQRITLQSDTLGAARFSFIEKRQNTALAALVTPGIASSGIPAIQDFIDSWETFNGYPIMDITPDWSRLPDIGYERDGRDITLGFGVVSELLGPRPHYVEECQFTFTNRAAAWRMLRFVDWRGGGVYPFYMVSRTKQFQVIDIDETKLTVEPLWAASDWDFYPLLGFIHADGTHEVKEIASVERVGQYDEITFSVPFPGMLSPASFRRITTAHLVEFENSEIEETWITDEIVSMRATFIETVAERDVTIALLNDPPAVSPSFQRPEPDAQCSSIINPV